MKELLYQRFANIEQKKGKMLTVSSTSRPLGGWVIWIVIYKATTIPIKVKYCNLLILLILLIYNKAKYRIIVTDFVSYDKIS